jgi:hypothetical protein
MTEPEPSIACRLAQISYTHYSTESPQTYHATADDVVLEVRQQQRSLALQRVHECSNTTRTMWARQDCVCTYTLGRVM